MTVTAKYQVNERQRDTSISWGRSQKELNKKPRIYFHHEGENVLENFGNRAARPTKLYKNYLLQAMKEAGLPHDTKVVWDRYAGCSMCPCSPGFVCQTTEKKVDIWVTLSADAPRVSDDPEKVAEAQWRTAQLGGQLTKEGTLVQNEDDEYRSRLETLLG